MIFKLAFPIFLLAATALAIATGYAGYRAGYVEGACAALVEPKGSPIYDHLPPEFQSQRACVEHIRAWKYVTWQR